MGSVAVSVVRCEYNQCVLPEILPVDFIDDYSYLGINGFNQPAICIAVKSPVIRTVVHARIESVPESLLIAEDLGVVRADIEIVRKIRAVFDSGCRHISVRSPLSACKFTYVVRVDV